MEQRGGGRTQGEKGEEELDLFFDWISYAIEIFEAMEIVSRLLVFSSSLRFSTPLLHDWNPTDNRKDKVAGKPPTAESIALRERVDRARDWWPLTSVLWSILELSPSLWWYILGILRNFIAPFLRSPPHHVGASRMEELSAVDHDDCK